MRTCVNRKSSGFTLVELLVVIAIIGILVALLLPAIQAAREAARRTSCQNNVKQLALALHQYAAAKKSFPPSMYFFGTGDSRNSPWSAQARTLPYLEEGGLESTIDYKQSYNTVRIHGDLVSAIKVPGFICPSEQRAERRATDAEITHVPINYGLNFGTWFVFDSGTFQGGDGMFFPNSAVNFQHCTDGTSKTLLISEIKTFQPFDTGSGKGTAVPADSSSAICGLASGTIKETGHTEWVDGKIHETGFTTALPPNAVVNCNGVDLDWINSAEGKNAFIPTFAVVTSRSYHAGGVVNAGMVDGSVQAIGREIEPNVWKSMGSRGSDDL